MIREWRAALLAGGVPVSVTSKAYRLVRTILTKAVKDDKLLPVIRAGSAVPGPRTRANGRS